MRCLRLGLALLAPGPVAALRLTVTDAPLAVAANGESTNFGTDASAAAKFFFLAHHKTGSMLLVNLCRETARVLSDGRESCNVCMRVLGVNPDGSLKCPQVDRSLHSPESVSAVPVSGRFHAFPNMDSDGLGRLRGWAPDYRAVHMVRDPVQMLVSNTAYDISLYKTAPLFTWDCILKRSVFETGSLEDQLRNVSYGISHYVDHMCQVQKATKADPHIMEMDLALFKSNYTQAARQLFSFLFGGQYPRMEKLMDVASPYELKHTQKKVTDRSEAVAIEKKVREMMEAGDKTIAASTSCEGAEEARPWAGKFRHFGSTQGRQDHLAKNH